MPTPTYNPYLIDTIYSTGLDYVINNITISLPTHPTTDDLVNTVYAYINGLSWFSATPGSLETEIKSVAYSAINSYCNGQIGNYSGAQLAFINKLIGPSFKRGLPMDSLGDRIADTEDNIPKSGLNVEQQTPLYLTTAIGQTTYNYFINAIGTPGNWATFFNAKLLPPANYLAVWSAAGMQGSLIGASSPVSFISPTIDATSNKIIQALIGALVTAPGEVFFNWIARMQNNGMMAASGCGCH